jgi:excisionase family DNA binding protein
MPAREYLTIEEAAQELKCSDKHIRRLISAKRLRAWRFGDTNRVIRIERADLDKLRQPVA